MPTNDFKAFAVSVAANVLTQAEYVTLLAALTDGGYVTGIAPSAALNKTWRQSSIMAAALGTIINDITGDSAIDDGTTAAIVTSLENAIKTLALEASASTSHVATTGGSTTLSPAQYDVKFIEVTGVLTANATLVFPTQAGDWFVINGTTGAHTLTCKTAAGTGVTVAQGHLDHVVCDEINISYSLAVGTAAFENIGNGLEDDGAGNLRVMAPDNSLRVSAAGTSGRQKISSVSTAQALVLASNGTLFVATAAVVFTAPLSSTLFDGYKVSVYAFSGASTFTPNAADTVNGGAAGVSFSIVQGQSVDFVTNGAGAWWPISRTTPAGAYYPLYEAANVTVGAGTYMANTTGGSFTITLPAGPSVGDSCTFLDAAGTWAALPLTIGRNGRTIMGLAENLVANVAALDFTLWFNGTSWRLR